MKMSTSVMIKFKGLPLLDESFLKMGECFLKAKFKPENELRIHIKSQDEWVRGFTLGDRATILPRGDCLGLAYSASDEPSIWIMPTLTYDSNFVCHRMHMVTPGGRLSSYFQEEIEWARRIEALCFCLHKSLEATSTCGRCENDTDDWFYFSKRKWKNIGELPLSDYVPGTK